MSASQPPGPASALPADRVAHGQGLPCTRESSLTFSCYGARIGIYANDPTVLDVLRPHLPPRWQPIPAGEQVYRYALLTRLDSEGRRLYTGCRGPEVFVEDTALDRVVDQMADALHVTVSGGARDVLFVHAGVVGWRGRAILVPGPSHSGKTALAKALVEAGATYYSDEFAVLDAEGRVHPYARPLGVRDAAGHVTKVPVAQLGGTAGSGPLPVGLVAALRYEPGAPWRPQARTPGQAALRLLENTVLARQVPEQALGIFRRLLEQAHALAGTRGEAAHTARELLHVLDSAANS